jgi:hypothetical protein
MAFIRRHIKLMFVFVLPVYFYVVQNTIQNKHTHVSASGMVVTHSHPFDEENENPADSHDHSKMEICLYCGLFSDFYTTANLHVLPVTTNEQNVNYLIKNERVHYNTSLRSGVTRGPPEKTVSPTM